ncbi:MAG: hypothetical protein R3C40_06920 [Parvularculaceae bacterium]
MTTIERIRRNAVAAAVAAVFAVAIPGGALAAGTEAGTAVNNSFTLDYKVGGVSQTQIDTSGSPTSFVVDRMVDVTVTSLGNTNVSPGATGQQISFSVLNSGNDNQAYRLSLKDTGADAFDATSLSVVYYVDDGNGTFEPGAADGAGVSYTPGAGVSADIAPDAILWVVVSGDIPAGATNGQQDDVILIANSFDPTAWINLASATPGSETTGAAPGANTAGGVENVLADSTGTAGSPEDVANDGAHSATGSFIVATAVLTAGKTVAVVTTTPTNCATDAIAGGFSVPGACIEYVITATNAATAASAANEIAISDVLPDDVEFVAATQSGFANDATTGPVSISTPVGGCTTGCTVSLSGASLAVGASGSLTIRATVR